MSSQCLPLSTTVDCYEFWDRVFRRGGVLDYTEGLYHGDPAVSYQEAQQNQIRFLLDEVGCRKGSQILDIGCGNGTLLEEVRRRDATGVGVTISPQQAQFCANAGSTFICATTATLPRTGTGGSTRSSPTARSSTSSNPRMPGRDARMPSTTSFSRSATACSIRDPTAAG